MKSSIILLIAILALAQCLSQEYCDMCKGILNDPSTEKQITDKIVSTCGKKLDEEQCKSDITKRIANIKKMVKEGSTIEEVCTKERWCTN